MAYLQLLPWNSPLETESAEFRSWYLSTRSTFSVDEMTAMMTVRTGATQTSDLASRN
jgi:hypothetical protein